MDAAHPELDPEALLRESAWLRRLARGLLGEGAAAEDLSQDVLVAALDRRPGLEGPRLRGWLRTVARRLAQRSRARRGLREHVERQLPPRDDAERDSDRRVELLRDLSAALGELEPGDRSVLVLRYFDGYSTAELARHLGVHEPAARKRVSRALERLRERLDARSGGERRVWSAAFVAALTPRTSEPLLPALPIATLLAGIMTKTTLTVAALGVVCIWLAVSRPWIARPGESTEAIVAVGPELTELLPSADDATQGTRSLAQNERLALDLTAAIETPPAARVRVVDADGAAIAGARAAWIDTGGIISALALGPDGSAPRPEASPHACFVAVADGYGVGKTSAPSQADDLVITLPSTRTLTGRVLEDGVAPLEPLRLHHVAYSSLRSITSLEYNAVELMRTLDVLPVSRVVHTDPDGCFSVQGLMIREGVELRLPTTHLLLSVDGRPQGGHAWIAADSRDARIETARLPCVVGRMVWEDTGEPLVGTFHTAFQNRQDVNTITATDWLDEHGHFSFGVPIEPHAIQAPFETRGDALSVRSVRIAASEIDGTSLPFEHKVDLTDVSFPLDVGTLRVPRAPVWHVRIVGPEGAPSSGAVVASDIERASTDAEGRVRIAAHQGPLRVLALDCALGEFELPAERTSLEAPLELRLAPGATLEVPAHRGADTNPWGGQSVRFSWSESPFEGARFVGPGREPMPFSLHRKLLGMDWKNGSWGNGPGMPGRVSLVLPMKGHVLVPGWRLGATARVELLDAADQPLAELALRVPDSPGRFTVDLTGLEPDAGRLRLCATDASGRLLGRTSFYVRPQGSTQTKYVHVDASVLDLRPLVPGRYDVTVRVHGFLAQQLDGLEAASDAPDGTIVVLPARSLTVELADEAGQSLRASALELRGDTGRWSPRSLTYDQVPGWVTVSDLPCTPLECAVVIGTRTWKHTVDAEQTTLALNLPVHGRLGLSVHARELLTGDDGRLAVKLRELDGEGSLAEEVSVNRDGVGPVTATFDLLPGRYELAIDFEEYENLEVALETDEPLRRPLLRREIEVRARERTDVDAGHN